MTANASSTKRKVFGLRTALVAVLGIALVGASGWLAYRVNNHTSKSPVAYSTTVATLSSAQSISSSNQPMQTAKKYLSVTEWGVNVPLPSSIEKAYYVVPVGMAPDSDGKPSAVFVSAHSLDSACGVLAANGSGTGNRLGEILRVQPSGTDERTGELFTQEYPNGVTINGWYYVFHGTPINTNCTKDSAASSAVSAFQSATKSAVSATAEAN